MGTFEDHICSDISKMLLVGDNGSAKTGALASLANAGYKLRIWDYDNGLDVLKAYVEPKFFKNISYMTLTDKLKRDIVTGLIVPDGPPKAWNNGVKLMNNWKIGDEELGPMNEWGSDTVVVIDSLDFMAKSCMRHVMAENKRWSESQGKMELGKPTLNDYGSTQTLIEDVLAILHSSYIKCNVIVISHLVYIGGGDDEDRPLKIYPATIGRALSPNVGNYFNIMVHAKTVGSGQSMKRVLRTISEPLLDLKVPVPGLDTEIPLEDGLLKIFKAVQANGEA